MVRLFLSFINYTYEKGLDLEKDGLFLVDPKKNQIPHTGGISYSQHAHQLKRHKRKQSNKQASKNKDPTCVWQIARSSFYRSC